MELQDTHTAPEPQEQQVPPQNGPSFAPPAVVPPTYFSTGLLDCFVDEEVCWWGCWCPGLVLGRTAAQFSVAGPTSWRWRVVIVALFTVLLLVSSGVFSILTLALLSVGLLYRRCSLRGKIRERLRYTGSAPEDCTTHWCCSRCGICQEAREAKAYGLRPMDFCTNQPLADIEEAHERAVGRVIDSASDILLPTNGSFASHLGAVSTLSRRLALLVLLLFALYTLYNPPDKSGLVLLIFVQPLLILYIFYWRTRRQYASLDLVWKMFFVGFFISTIQSALAEGVLEIFAAFVVSFGLGINVTTLLGSESESESGSSEVFGGSPEQWFRDGVSALRGHSVSSVLSWVYGPEHHAAGILSGLSASTASGTADDPVVVIQNNIGLAILLSFLAAFAMAAAVEETMKVRTIEMRKYKYLIHSCNLNAYLSILQSATGSLSLSRLSRTPYWLTCSQLLLALPLSRISAM